MPLQRTSRIVINPVENVASAKLYGNSVTLEQFPMGNKPHLVKPRSCYMISLSNIHNTGWT